MCLLTHFFISRHSEDVQFEALQKLFDKFLDETSNVETALCVIERFLEPMLLQASTSAVTRFYAERIQTIIDVLEEKLKWNDNEWKVT